VGIKPHPIKNFHRSKKMPRKSTTEEKEVILQPIEELVEKIEEKKKSYKVEFASYKYVFYLDEVGNLNRTPNIWGDIKKGEAFFLK
jgi:hypothetical protein